MDPLEGLVLYTIGYEDGGRVRPILYRASVSEMVVPYGDPGPMHAWKSAFDAGEWGLGRMANSLTLGCDCLGEIRYFDDVFADERGKPRTRPNAICMHEEDYGILWKHVDMVSGRTEVRRSRRLVVSSIATVGQLRVRLLLVLLPRRHHAARGEADRHHVHHGGGRRRAGAPRQHDRPRPGGAVPPAPVQRPARHGGRRDRQRGLRGGRGALGARGPGEPVGQRLRDDGHPARERAGGPARRRPVTQPLLEDRQPITATTALGQPTAYKLLPGATPTLLADPSSSVGRAGRLRVAQPVGHAVRSGASGGPQATTPTSTTATPAAGVDGAGPSDRRHRYRGVALVRGHAHSPARGLAGHARRVHRLQPPARSGSSTATPRSTCRLPPTIAMTERSAVAHEPQEYHPPVEEYLETMLVAGRGGHPGHSGPHRRATRAVRPVGLRDARPPHRRRLRDPGGPATRPDRERAGPGRKGRAQAPPGRAPPGRRHRAGVAQGAPGGGPLGARHLRRRRGSPGGAAGRPGHLPARQPDPGLPFGGALVRPSVPWPRSSRGSGCASCGSARRSSSTSAR